MVDPGFKDQPDLRAASPLRILQVCVREEKCLSQQRKSAGVEADETEG